MSDKIPISLHNSDLFLNPDFTDTDQEKINTDDTNNFILKKGPNFGKNNHLVALHSSYVVPPLPSSTYLNQAVSSYLLTTKKIANTYKGAQLERNKDWMNHNQEKKQALLSATGSSFGKGMFPLRYELRSGLTPRSKSQVELRDQESRKSKLCFEEKTEPLFFNKTTSRDHLTQFDTKIDNSSKKPLLGLCLRFLDKVNKKVSFSISREFLLVMINFILLSFLAVVQRSYCCKSPSTTNSRNLHPILCKSKLSNITPSYLSPTGVRNHWYQMKSGHLNPIREHITGVFSGNMDSCRTERERADCKNKRLFVKTLFLHNETSLFYFLPGDRERQTPYVSTFPIKTLQGSTGFTGPMIPPWYCMRSCNILDNKVVATRASSQINTNVNLYHENQIRGIQYYLPFYQSKDRVFAESDTIPSKKDRVGYLKTKDLDMYRKLESSSCISVSQSVANKCFYKHGLLLVSPLKTISESQGSKRTNKDSFVRSHSLDESLVRTSVLHKQRSNVTEFDDNCVVDKLDLRTKTPFLYNPFCESTIYRTELDCRATSNSNVIRVRNGYILLSKRKSTLFGADSESVSFIKRSNKPKFSLDKKIETSLVRENLSKPSSLKEESETFFTTLKASTQESPFFATRTKANAKANAKAIAKTYCKNFVFTNKPKQLLLQERVFKQKSYLHTFVSTVFKSLLPVVSESRLTRYSLILSKIYDQPCLGKDKTSTKPFFPLGLVWSRFNLSKLGFAAFVPVQNKLQIFGFTPDSLAQNSFVSGYKFPGLEEKEISHLFRKRAIFHYYLDCAKSENKPFVTELTKNKVERLFTQLTTPFRNLSTDNLVRQAVSTPFLTEVDGVIVDQANVKRFDNEKVFGSKDIYKSTPLEIDGVAFIALQKQRNKHKKMQYTQVDLDEIKDISSIFKRLGQNYEDYLRKPKDSLPALVISPSLEDDREIEEEGIRIFRKRDLVKNKTLNLQGKSNEPDNDKSWPSLLSTAPESLVTKGMFDGSSSKSELQNHQVLVKNALRQAQEEIDSIAKKEEKGSEKDKQVIPPLTRLEALYTIRNRERKHEQAKDVTSERGMNSYRRPNKAKLPFRGSTKGKYVTSETGRTANHASLPIFERLSLYSDKAQDVYSNERARHCQNKSDLVCKAFSCTNATKHSTWKFAKWVFSKLGDETMYTDRKHSFFGELSLPSKKLTAQEQKQIFQQKANGLLRLSAKAKLLHKDVVSKSNNDIESRCKNFAKAQQVFTKQSTVVPSLLSQFSGVSKANYNKNEVTRFQIGPVIALSKQSYTKANTDTTKSLPDLFISKSRAYFYDNLSQNKICQISAPRIKNTPLQSPVSHRVWQPKRMEPTTFRVSQRNKVTHVVPRITQQDWKNIVEWQLKKYLVEENKRLYAINSHFGAPLSLNNKTLKLKQVNLYLPWISIKDTTDSQQSSAWPLTRLDFTKNPTNCTDSQGLFLEPGDRQNSVHTQSTLGFAEQRSEDTSNKSNRYWQLPTQQSLYTTALPIRRQIDNSTSKTIDLQQKLHLHTINTQTVATSYNSKAISPKATKGICKKIVTESILFESVTRYSWLFIYIFVSVVMFKQLFTLVYKLGLKDFFINFLNSDFGRTITSEDFRYSVQNPPLTEFYRPTKRLEEIFGLEKNKLELLEIVWFLRNNCQGRHGVRGILLVGVPGVENVSVVQAIAGEANLPIIVQSLEKIAQDNEPQRQLEQLYMRAQKHAPCVLFLDQLDSVGARRDQLFTDRTVGQDGNPLNSLSAGRNKQVISNFSSPNPLHSNVGASVVTISPEVNVFENQSNTDNTINGDPFQTNQSSFMLQDENTTIGKNSATDRSLHPKQSSVSPGNKLNVVLRLLTILDGITQSSGVITVATARDVTKLDPALLRPKRFDRRIYLSLPTQQDRVHLFKIQTQSIGHDKEMPWNYLSLQTENMSAVDIRSAINYSLFRAVLRNSVHTVETLEYGIACVKSLTDKRVVKK